MPQISEPVLSVNPASLSFSEEGETKTVQVTITNQPNASYSITGLPEWLSVSRKTQSGFDLTATAAPDENNRTAELTVVLDNYPSISATLHVNQGGQWLSTFIFDVDIPSEDVNQSVRIFNAGTDRSFGSLGEARIDWEGDGNWETILNVPYGSELTPAPNDPATGGTISVLIGRDYSHTYPTAGSRTVMVQTRNGVNAFRFATPSSDTNNEGFDMLPAENINRYVTTVRKMQSDYILNGNMMFYGVKYGSFEPSFVLECPNLELYYYMFYFFGTSGYNSSNVPLSYDLRFPENFFANIADRTKATHAIRMYAASGFTVVTRAMLKFSTVLTSVIECWRGMPLVGNNWAQRTGALANTLPIVEEFVKTDLFYDNPNINDYRGAFWFINDSYGLYPDSGNDYKWNIRADLFKFCTASDIDLSWMFRQANRSIVEVDFFRHIKERLVKFNGIFWGCGNYGKINIAAFVWLMPGWSSTGNTDASWAESEFNLDYRGMTDLNLLFPDNSYPNVEEAVCSFGWRTGTNGTAPDGIKRSVYTGVHYLYGQPYGSQNFGATWRGNEWDTGIIQNPVSIQQFLSKFPKCTPTSGRNPLTGETVDGFFASFWDLDVQDSAGQAKASDYNNTTRNDVFREANMVGWDWGTSV